jgi:phosphocarrier protein FPr
MTDQPGRVALVLVSHSQALADGVAALVRQMVGERVKLLCAAGAGDNGAELGTDAMRILEAITAADNPAGTIVLMDLGSAILSTEMALDLAEPAIKERVALSAAPFVEGALAAAVAAAGGASRAAILDEAGHALAPKAVQLGTPPQSPTGTPGQAATAAAEGEASSKGPHVVAEVVIRDPHGLHARPAGQVAALAGSFRAEISIDNLDGGKGPGDARSLIALLSVSARAGHHLRIAATGPDAERATSALRTLIEGFSADAVIAGIAPRPSRKEPIPVSPGIAIGELFDFKRNAPPIPTDQVADTGAELANLDIAVTAVAKDLETISGIGADIAMMQSRLLRDPMLLAVAQAFVTKERLTAAAAFAAAAEDAAKIYQTLDDPYLRAREADLRDVTRAVIGRLVGAAAPSLPKGSPVILLADELAPADLLGLEPTSVIGVIDRRGGPTSHTAILLRGLGIPAIAGAGARIVPGAERAAFDGGTGEVVFDPSPEETVSFQRRRDAWIAQRAKSTLTNGCVTMADGTAVEIWANVANVAEARAGRDAGAAGIGLLRTEMMFLDRQTAPSEAEQTARLQEIFAVFAGRPIIVRTLDSGGDKPVPYMNMAKEANPYLGVRGLRLSLREMAVFETQLRAILRAGAGHDLRIMLPMVTEAAELVAARDALKRAHDSLERDKVACAWPVPLGIMIEVPAAAVLARQLVRVSDFFSVGTNDLTQYALAAERGNTALDRYADAAHPAVLALIADAVSAADEAGVAISVCGEAAGDATVALLLTGLGIRKLSMGAAAIPMVAGRLAEAALAPLSRAATEALATDAAHEARAKVGLCTTSRT